MDESQLKQIRRFNRLVTQRVGALEANYLRRGRPLAEARLIFEIGADGVDLRTLRVRLGLDSGYLSRLVQSLKAQGLDRDRQGERGRPPAPGQPDAQGERGARRLRQALGPASGVDARDPGRTPSAAA